MIYTITHPTKSDGDVLLSFGSDASEDDIARGRALAKALRGRWVRGLSAHALQPANARKWVLLFDAGFSVVRGGSDTVPSHLAFVRDGGRYALCLAVRIARAEVESGHLAPEEVE